LSVGQQGMADARWVVVVEDTIGKVGKASHITPIDTCAFAYGKRPGFATGCRNC